MTIDPIILDKISNSFNSQGLMTTLYAQLGVVKSGYVEISAPITAAVAQQHGFGHAGLTFSIGDSAAGYAALSVMAPDQEVLTVEMKINLIAPAAGVRLVAIGEVIKPGRRLIVTKATVYAEDQDGTRKPVAVLLGTMIPA
jgi:uncharacterized protein (TIGR00369 family)